MTDCVFCVKIADLDGVFTTAIPTVWRFEPLGPVTSGHMLFVSEVHATDAAEDPVSAAYALMAAAEYGRHQKDDFNIITSIGKDATQSILHTHIHYVPRRPDDGLHLPWTGQVKPKPETFRGTAEKPVIIEYPEDGQALYPRGSIRKTHYAAHIHDQNGRCRKNRFGGPCD